MPRHDHYPMFGRVEELALLKSLLEGARDGQSGVRVVHGDPGIGKTALLCQLEREAPGFRVLRGFGIESETELPFAGLHRLCTPLLGRMTSLPEPQRRALSTALGFTVGDKVDRFLVAMGALSLIADAAQEKPVLCVIDDVHWLDQASAQVLGFVGRHLPAGPIVLVFAARPEAGKGGGHLSGLPELALGGLDEESAEALLGANIPGRLDESVRRRIVAETHGNPRDLLGLYQGRGPAGLAGGFAFPGTAGLPAGTEDQYISQLRQLSSSSRQLLLLASADMTAETSLIYRAARVLGLDTRAVASAAAAGLVDISANVRFRNPFMRSAVYRAADAEDRRMAHGALAAVTDPERDPDRRAWHRAHAAAAPDEAVARELTDSAGHAQRRGGMAAAAAFWEQAVVLTPEPGDRATRALTAAEAKFAAGDFTSAQASLAIAQAGPISELDRARAQRLAAHIAFALGEGRDAPAVLLDAAQRLQDLDAGLARRTCLEALAAAVHAGRLNRDGGTSAIAKAARSTLLAAGEPGQAQLLLQGLALRLTDGYLAAAPLLRQALDCHPGHPREPEDWLAVACILAAMDLWDDGAWSDTATRMARQARTNGSLAWLPLALDYLAEYYVHAGELSKAAGLLAESECIDRGIRADMLPYVSLLLAAWRGDEAAAAELMPAMTCGPAARGEGAALAYAGHAAAILNNGLGRYDLAAKAALAASAADELAISPWALAELAEAAAYSAQREQAVAAVARLSAIASASGTLWSRGVAARSQALTCEGPAAEGFHVEAIELLDKTSVATQAARARLCYGEWLRREKRRTEARDQLRSAYLAFESMGAWAFSERAKRELQATGEKIHRRGGLHAYLTPQEEQIAQLACDGWTNQEIGTQLFIGSRTVEWHLGSIFAKLDITSRRGLDKALSGRLPVSSQAEASPS